MRSVSISLAHKHLELFLTALTEEAATQTALKHTFTPVGPTDLYNWWRCRRFGNKHRTVNRIICQRLNVEFCTPGSDKFIPTAELLWERIPPLHNWGVGFLSGFIILLPMEEQRRAFDGVWLVMGIPVSAVMWEEWGGMLINAPTPSVWFPHAFSGENPRLKLDLVFWRNNAVPTAAYVGSTFVSAGFTRVIVLKHKVTKI